MTVNQIVEKAINYFNGKAIEIKSLKRFLSDNNLKVPEELTLQIFDFYNRKLIDAHVKRGEENFPEDHRNFINQKKEMNMFIESISQNLSTLELVALKQKIDTLVDAAILWSKK
ncbi:MAG: hypothetical protein LBC77_03640 [Spirochaetaceae bacterium]|jgi:hypothetical protein|nr:hypothetical protein [Spirochaetaceae bacterium]